MTITITQEHRLLVCLNRNHNVCAYILDPDFDFEKDISGTIKAQAYDIDRTQQEKLKKK